MSAAVFRDVDGLFLATTGAWVFSFESYELGFGRSSSMPNFYLKRYPSFGRPSSFRVDLSYFLTYMS
jgi:hypothetical protein